MPFLFGSIILLCYICATILFTFKIHKNERKVQSKKNGTLQIKNDPAYWIPQRHICFRYRKTCWYCGQWCANRDKSAKSSRNKRRKNSGYRMPYFFYFKRLSVKMSEKDVKTKDTSHPVEFLNPRRKVRKWCFGYLQPQRKKKRGDWQHLIFFPGSPEYFVWVCNSFIHDI